jgi:hypothetical protein
MLPVCQPTHNFVSGWLFYNTVAIAGGMRKLLWSVLSIIVRLEEAIKKTHLLNAGKQCYEHASAFSWWCLVGNFTVLSKLLRL